MCCARYSVEQPQAAVDDYTDRQDRPPGPGDQEKGGTYDPPSERVDAALSNAESDGEHEPSVQECKYKKKPENFAERFVL